MSKKDTISFSGTASDAQDALGPASMHWSVILHLCATQTQCHEHPQGTFDGVAGGSYIAPEHKYPSYLEVRLRVTDSRGLTSDASVRLDPKTIPVTFTTQPAGLQLTVGSGVIQTPATITAILNSRISVTANSPQTLGGTTYVFNSWSDGGAVSHDIVPPAGGATYTANFVPGVAKNALFVVGDPAGIPAADVAARNRLVALGYTVTTVDDNLTVPGDATGKQVVVISSTTSSANVNTKFRATGVPVVTWETALFDDLGMTAATGTFVAGQQSVVIAAPGNPMAAGLTGTVTVASAASATNSAPSDPIFRSLFQSGERTQPVSQAVRELWGKGSSLTSDPQAGSLAVASASSVPSLPASSGGRLDLFSDRSGTFSG